ncbi:aldehyde oxidase GLOX [Punica granatum]|uniref:Uncharacterized protein n=2 Tax=Punica granatum TaxID=22663 RepID=A0A2I0KJG1_PUNGR|nr:aldehyde oxidase GLOX [Punica granatum]PKI67926.1 hypothetical protein CRG98_011522 [Punica granatum]
MFTYFLLVTTPFWFLFSSIPASGQILPPYAGRYGEWRLLHESIGISAMHMQLLHNNKVVMFDRTDFGRSNLSLPGNQCRDDPRDTVLRTDCTAHSILYDIKTDTFRPLMVHTDTWCSSGGVLPNGTFVQTGGYNDGDHAIRTFEPCDDNSCDWVELQNYLSQRRWYATNQILPDGRIIIVGGRRQFNYEFYPRQNPSSSGSIWLNFLLETRDDAENNLYPFVHLLPDGNLFIFANTRSISLDYKKNIVVRQFPQMPVDDPRNYPSSGSSVLLPLDENKSIEVEILICGGAPRGSYEQAGQGNFMRASSSCGRIKATDGNPSWVMEDMPTARVMGDMLLLPTKDVIIVNGAEYGTAGWEFGHSPVTRPIIYRPYGLPDWRFSVMSPASRPRLYHSSAILILDGRILVGGSNPHVYYNFTNVEYPTDLSLEAFAPPYLSTEYDRIRPKIISAPAILRHGQAFSLSFYVPEYLTADVLSVNIIAPSFTTHSFSMSQRMVVLKLVGVLRLSSDTYNLTTVGPSTAEIAPPGYYMLFVVHEGIPSAGSWVNIQ